MRRPLLALLLLLSAVLLGLGVGGWAWLWYSDSGAQWLWQEARDRLAASPRAARLDGRLTGTLGGGLKFNDLVYRDADVTVKTERAELTARLDWSPTAVIVRRLSLSGVDVEINQGRETRPSTASGPTGALGTPLPIVVQSLRIDGAAVRRGDMQFPVDVITARGTWFEALVLEVSSLEAPLLAGNLNLEAKLAPPFPLESQIRVSRLTLPEPARAAVPWLPEPLESAFTVEGDRELLNVEGTIRWPDWMPEANIAGRVHDPLNDLSWTLGLGVPEALVPEEWQSRFADAIEPASTARMAVRGLSLQAAGGKTRYEFSGETDVRSPWTRAAALSFEGAGEGSTLGYWTADGQAEIAATGWPNATLQFTAAWREGVISAGVTAPELFGGAFAVSAETRPGEGMPWAGELTARHVSTEALLQTLAPQIGADRASRLEDIHDVVNLEGVDARIRASGRLDPLQVSADIEKLEGRLRGQAVASSGHVEYDDGDLSMEDFVVESGRSRLVLNGSFNGPPGVQAQVSAASLGDFLPESSGSLTGEIHYRYDRERGFSGSTLRADLQGNDLRVFDWSAEKLGISGLNDSSEVSGHPAVAAMAEAAPLAVSLEAHKVDGPLGPVSTLSAALAGDFERQALAATAMLRDVRLEAVVTGGATGDSLSAWEGTVEEFEIDPPRGAAWQLRGPVALRYAEQLTLETACLSPGGDSELCLDFERRRDGAQRGTISLVSLPIDLLARLTESPLRFSQHLDGEMAWNRLPDGKPSATAEFAVTEGVIFDPVEDLELLHTQDGMLRFSLDRGSLLSGNLKLPFDSGSIDIEFAVPDLLAGQESELDGRIRVDLQDLDALANFVPQLVQTDGRIRADIHVGGTAGDPRLDGVIELHEGRMQVLAPGLRLSDIELVGQLDDSSEVQVDGTFVAGEGRGEIRATIKLADPLSPGFDLEVKGEALTLVDVPDIRLLANPDLKASWNGEELRLSGQIHVPSARFAPRYQPSDTASESPDAVIVAGGVENGRPQTREPDWQIRGELEVSMGNDVVVDLDLAKATMKGEALFKWNGPAVPVASGEYDLRGEIQAYGQTLEITRAAVRFPNVPADNPHLDVRAERRIYGNSVITKAGVLVSGTLKRPQTEPYTVPPTNADRARALLITGSDFDYEQGVGAVNVGTYIAPRLYLSYGVGLFEEGNVITARYELRENFGIKATSGQNDTGIDISYTIEK